MGAFCRLVGGPLASLLAKAQIAAEGPPGEL